MYFKERNKWNLVKKKTHEQYVKEVECLNPNVDVLGVYDGSSKKISHYCHIHNLEWMCSPSNFLNHPECCPECRRDRKSAKMRWTREKYLEELSRKNPSVLLIGEYHGMRTKTTHLCLVHNVKWDTAPANVVSGKGCPQCHIEKIKAKKTRSHEEYTEILKHINSDIQPLEKYVNSTTPILHLCKKHGVEWKISPGMVLQGVGCVKCGVEKTINATRKTHEQYVIDVSCANPDIEVVGSYINANTKIDHKCRKHDYVWSATPNNILGGKGCPICKASKGELEIKTWLQSHFYSFEAQKRFYDCKDKYTLPFDFYIPSMSLCIEYDGIQHFQPVAFEGDEKRAAKMFETTKQHDLIKNRYCDQHGIKLLRIPYFSNIDEELSKIL